MKTALVIGCASGVWQEVRAAKALAVYDAIYCVKQMGIHYSKPFDVWITLHPEVMDDYERQRNVFDFPNGYQIVAPPKSELGHDHKDKGNIARRVSYLWNENNNASASSGIYGAKVALEDGFERIVLAGIPMTPEAGHFLPDSRTVSGVRRGSTWQGQSAFTEGYRMAVPFLRGKVRSMSGLTRDNLGHPTEEWLNGR